RKAAGLAGFRFHDLRHTVVTDLLEAGEPEHVIEAATGHLSRRMPEHYSHQRLKAKARCSRGCKSGERRNAPRDRHSLWWQRPRERPYVRPTRNTARRPSSRRT